MAYQAAAGVGVPAGAVVGVALLLPQALTAMASAASTSGSFVKGLDIGCDSSS